MNIESTNMFKKEGQEHKETPNNNTQKSFSLSLEPTNERQESPAPRSNPNYSECEKYVISLVGCIFLFLGFAAGINALMLNFQENGDEICDDNGRCEKLDKDKAWQDAERMAVVSGVGLACILLWVMQKHLRHMYAQRREHNQASIPQILPSSL